MIFNKLVEVLDVEFGILDSLEQFHDVQENIKFINHYLRRHMNFAVYTKDNCPYCEKIKKVMDLTKLSYVVYNLNEHFDKKSFIDEFGQGSTFPTSGS